MRYNLYERIKKTEMTKVEKTEGREIERRMESESFRTRKQFLDAQ